MSIFDGSDWMALLTGAGLGSAIAVVLLMQLIKERALDRDRITKLENFQQTTLIELIKKDSVAQEKTIAVIEESIKATRINSAITQKFIAAFDQHQKTLLEISERLKS